MGKESEWRRTRAMKRLHTILVSPQRKGNLKILSLRFSIANSCMVRSKEDKLQELNSNS